MDYRATRELNHAFVRHDGIADFIGAYAAVAEILFVALVALLFVFAAGAGRERLREGAVSATAAAAIALGLAQVVSGLVDRPRPFVAHTGAIHALLGHASDPSFPSDHATGAFAIATAIWLRSRAWGAGLYVLAFVLALGRVALGLHYPLDVTGGAVLGSAVALVLWAPPARRLTGMVAGRAGRVTDRALQQLRV